MSKDSNQGMDYLTSLPRRWVTIYIPLILLLVILLFPFYWMGMTAFKPNEELLSKAGNPFWLINPTLDHFRKLLFNTQYPAWLWNTVLVSVCSTFLSLFASVLAAYAIERLRFNGSKFVGMMIFFAYLVPPSIIFIPLASIVFQYGLFDTRWALILTYPTFLVPFCTWLLMGYFRSIPFELEECALIDGATRWQSFRLIVLPMVKGGIAAAAVLCFIFSWTEFLLSLFLTTEIRTIPVKISTFVTSTGNEWGFITALGTAAAIPSFIFILLVQRHLVRGLTLGSLKE